MADMTFSSQDAADMEEEERRRREAARFDPYQAYADAASDPEVQALEADAQAAEREIEAERNAPAALEQATGSAGAGASHAARAGGNVSPQHRAMIESALRGMPDAAPEQQAEREQRGTEYLSHLADAQRQLSRAEGSSRAHRNRARLLQPLYALLAGGGRPGFDQQMQARMEEGEPDVERARQALQRAQSDDERRRSEAVRQEQMGVQRSAQERQRDEASQESARRSQRDESARAVYRQWARQNDIPVDDDLLSRMVFEDFQANGPMGATMAAEERRRSQRQAPADRRSATVDDAGASRYRAALHGLGISAADAESMIRPGMSVGDAETIISRFRDTRGRGRVGRGGAGGAPSAAGLRSDYVASRVAAGISPEQAEIEARRLGSREMQRGIVSTGNAQIAEGRQESAAQRRTQAHDAQQLDRDAANYGRDLQRTNTLSARTALDRVRRLIAEARRSDPNADIPGYGATGVLPGRVVSPQGRALRRAVDELLDIRLRQATGANAPLSEVGTFRSLLGVSDFSSDEDLIGGLDQAETRLRDIEEGLEATYGTDAANAYRSNLQSARGATPRSAPTRGQAATPTPARPAAVQLRPGEQAQVRLHNGQIGWTSQPNGPSVAEVLSGRRMRP